MAITPRGIWTPDSGEEYDLTVDAATTASTIDNALQKAANYGVGTQAEMNAAVNDFPNGAMWFNTTNSTEYRRVSGAWARTVEDTGVFAVPGSGPAGWTQNSTARIKDGVATIAIDLTAASGRPGGTIEGVIPSDPRWGQTLSNDFRFLVYAGEIVSARMFTSGNVNVYSTPALPTGSRLYGTLTFPVG